MGENPSPTNFYGEKFHCTSQFLIFHRPGKFMLSRINLHGHFSIVRSPLNWAQILDLRPILVTSFESIWYGGSSLLLRASFKLFFSLVSIVSPLDSSVHQSYRGASNTYPPPQQQQFSQFWMRFSKFIFQFTTPVNSVSGWFSELLFKLHNINTWLVSFLY